MNSSCIRSKNNLGAGGTVHPTLSPSFPSSLDDHPIGSLHACMPWLLSDYEAICLQVCLQAKCLVSLRVALDVKLVTVLKKLSFKRDKATLSFFKTILASQLAIALNFASSRAAWAADAAFRALWISSSFSTSS